MRSLNQAHIHPGVVHILSGDFEPSTDRLGRRHTLSALALSTYEKGGEGHSTYDLRTQYQPSWAPHVLSAIDWKGQGTHTFRKMTLRDPYENLLEFDQYNWQFLKLKGFGHDFNYDLSSTKELSAGRTQAAELAEVFFTMSQRSMAEHVSLDIPAPVQAAH